MAPVSQPAPLFHGAAQPALFVVAEQEQNPIDKGYGGQNPFFHVSARGLGHRIKSTGTKRMASQQSPDTQIHSCNQSFFFNRLIHILRTRRLKPAGRRSTGRCVACKTAGARVWRVSSCISARVPDPEPSGSCHRACQRQIFRAAARNSSCRAEYEAAAQSRLAFTTRSYWHGI